MVATQSSAPSPEKSAKTAVPLHDLLARRYSPRIFSDRPIPEQDVLRLLEAARWAPSSRNAQPWAFILAPKEDAEARARLESTLSPGNATWAPNAPLLILTLAQDRNDEGYENTYAWYDLGLAVSQLTIQATALNLSVRTMGGFDKAKARELFAIPEGYTPMTVLAVGYHGDVAGAEETLRQREGRPRQRRPLHEFVFAGRWGESAPLVEED